MKTYWNKNIKQWDDAFQTKNSTWIKTEIEGVSYYGKSLEGKYWKKAKIIGGKIIPFALVSVALAPLALPLIFATKSYRNWGRWIREIRYNTTLQFVSKVSNQTIKIPSKNSSLSLSKNKSKTSPPLNDDLPASKDMKKERWLSHDHLQDYHITLLNQYLHLAENITEIRRIHPTRGEMIIPIWIPSCSIEPIEGVMKGFDEALLSIIKYNDRKNPEKSFIALPLHVSENHWALIVLDREKRTLEYYDSKQNYGDHKKIISALNNFTAVLTEEDPGKPYKFECKINKCLQPDSYQCGIWCLYFLENRLKNPDIDFNNLNINEAQKMIAQHRLYLADFFLNKTL